MVADLNPCAKTKRFTVLRLESIRRDLKQARTATVVNKQLNFTVKNKPHTTNYIYCIFEAYFMLKSVRELY